MQKPDDIPQDIWDTAHRAIEDNDFTGRGPSVVERCARAILEERERSFRARRQTLISRAMTIVNAR